MLCDVLGVLIFIKLVLQHKLSGHLKIMGTVMLKVKHEPALLQPIKQRKAFYDNNVLKKSEKAERGL
jgi:hypothetical protein